MNKLYIPVEDNKGLVRESFSKAILTVDRNALSRHRDKKKMMKELIDNSAKIEKLEQDINEIKQLLHQLLGKN